jgi:hypothetical protein
MSQIPASAGGGEHSSKELFEQRINSYSEHLHMSPRQHKLLYAINWHCMFMYSMLSTRETEG